MGLSTPEAEAVQAGDAAASRSRGKLRGLAAEGAASTRGLQLQARGAVQQFRLVALNQACG